MTQRSTLVIGGNRFPFHQFEKQASRFEAILADTNEVALTTEKDDLKNLSDYDVIIDYLTDSSLTDSQRDGLLSFVDNGGGYIGIHCAADLNSTEPADPNERIDSRQEPFPELRELIGGHFVEHPNQTTFGVQIVNHYHPVTASMGSFQVWDEPYILEVDEDVTVLARMDHPVHADMPVVWTKSYGEGAVFYCSLGHDEHALTNSSVGTLIRNGVRWVDNNDS